MFNRNSLNVPNLLTIIRILFIPFFLLFLFISKAESNVFLVLSIFLFIFSIFTDQLDGYFARKYDLVTDLGKFLDPIADKLLIISAMIALTILNLIPFWITLLIFLREIFITLYRLFKLKDRVISADNFGKLKTIFQSLSVLLTMMAPFGLSFIIINFFWIVTLLLTFYSGLRILFY